MAQSGYTPILIYASGTATNVPLAANLTSSASGAELALNYADGKLYYKNSSGVVTLLAGSGGGGPAAGSNTQIQFNNSGVFGASANLTWSGTVLATTGLTATGAITLNTTTNNQSYTTTGAGTITISSGTAGSINNMSIGATTAAAATFTNLTYTGTLTGSTGVIAIGTNQIYKDSSGNVGLTVVPSAWAANHNALQIQTAAVSLWSDDGQNAWFATNLYGSASGVQRYLSSSYAAAYRLTRTTGEHVWYTVPSGTAGNVATLTSVMTLDTSGNLSLNNNASLQFKNSSGTYLAMFTLFTDNNFYYGPSGAFTGAHIWYSNGAERMRIDSSGNVGIGTSSPGAKLDVTNNQAALSYLIDTNNTTNGGSSIWRMITRNIANTGTTSVEFYKPTGSGFSLLNNDTNASNFTSFNVGASERMRINSSGLLGVGITSPVGRIDSLANGYAAFVARSAGSGAGQSVASLTSIDSTASNYAAAIYAASVHAFYIATTEVARFDANGKLGVGTVTPTGQIHSYSTGGQVGVAVNATNNHGVLSQVAGAGYGVYGYSSSSSYGGVLGYDPTNVYFTILGYGGYSLYANSSAYIGGIVYPSDRRLKENDQNITNALNKIMQLRAVSFDWKAESSRGIQKGGATPDYGFIAQEVETVLPNLVYSATSPARPNNITSPLSLEEQLGEHKGIDYARFVPFLTAAIQEQQALITTLTARIEALEAH